MTRLPLRGPGPLARLALASTLASTLAAACGRGTPPTDASAAAARDATGDSLPVTLTAAVRQPRPDDRLLGVAASGGPGLVAVVWELRSGPCMLASPAARRAGDEIVVRVTRGGDPAALCLAGEVVYRYDITVRDVPAGSYRVRVVEQPVEQAARDAGSARVTVRPAGA